MTFGNTFRSALKAVVAAAPLLAALSTTTLAQPAKPWLNTTLSPDERASLLERELTLDERVSLVHGPMALPFFFPGGKLPDGALPAAGFVRGIPRLGIPNQVESDASLGVTNPMGVRPGDFATALPSSLALAATFNPQIAYDGGAVVGLEARTRGINVQLAGGVNLARDPRNGRNFEYAGEDPLLAGTLVGESIRGVQSQNVISTIKHYALNGQETGRNFANSVIDEQAMRESDLLAFQIAIEKGQPGSVMCAYNLINGAYACGHDFLLNKVLKQDWGYKGYVMSDWGAVKSTDFAMKGLDQQSGEQLDKDVWFGAPLKAAVENGTIPASRLSDMSHRILRSMFAAGLFDTQAPKTYDAVRHAAVAKTEADEAIVLLKNEGDILPVAATARSILVVGGHADAGVISGGGSSQVTAGPDQLVIAQGGEGPMAMFNRVNYHPSSPLKALRARLPDTRIAFDTGLYPEEVARKARSFDLVIVFATQWTGEGEDVPSLNLPHGQNALIEAAATANPKTIVVLQTGNAVNMPWLSRVPAVIEAWYPGQEGGAAIADVLTGATNPSGHLPVTFPASIEQYPRVNLPGIDAGPTELFDVVYEEGADVGYRRFAKLGMKPLFPFGHGLSYSDFSYGDLKVSGGNTVEVSFTVTNTGKVRGKDAPQVYLNATPGGKAKRLIAFSKVDLAPGETKTVVLAADPRLLASFDTASNNWVVAGGTYTVAVAEDADDAGITGSAQVKAQRLKP
ncbi:thermostable beta-glucosidase B [Asticcacaulis biprosthecium C19]|uniref:Thermostable beta-glucosidase B n=1 Tax=Asticcacaulis biprosthecium C19 TaxID=715226 RepID=F4QMJ9_9CAUL|nr:glycoside hydrolase family 3 protein [Asticcacaulis biprosthecium]EGF91440.1 thermostable beta-glucosidase B [Asticcacaulis biprosthecium C19]